MARRTQARRKQMKLNNWSIVRSPKGVSAKPLSMHTDIEVCVSVTNGKLDIGVYRDGHDHALKRVKMAIKPPKKKKINKYIFNPSVEAVEKVGLWSAKRAFRQGNDFMCWFYLLGIEFYKGESK
jgi:hypothetical protein